MLGRAGSCCARLGPAARRSSASLAPVDHPLLPHPSSRCPFALPAVRMLATCFRAALRTTAVKGGATPLGGSLRRAVATEPSSPAPTAFASRATFATPLPSPGSSLPSGSGEQRPNEIMIDASGPRATSAEGAPPVTAGSSEPPPSSSAASPTGNPTAYPSIPTLHPLPTPPTQGGSTSASASAAGSSSSPPFARPPHPHPFDTHSIVKHLEAAGFSHDASREVMRATRELVLRRTEQARSELLGKEDMENVRVA